jgi:hypothetical protein
MALLKLTNVLGALNAAKTRPEGLRAALGVQCNVYREKNPEGPVRLCVSLARGTVPRDDLEALYSGLILEYNPTGYSWRVLATPPPANIHNVPESRILELLAGQVYPLVDHTQVNLYWHGGDWRISTRNSYDASDYKFIHETTYLEAFNECYAESWDHFNPAYCYNFSFRHPSFHPLAAAHELLLVGCTSMSELATVPAADVKSVLTGAPFLDFQTPARMPRMSGKGLLGWIEAKNAGALAKYLDRRPNFHEEHYGYVLKSAAGTVLLESSLYTQIRKLVYTLPDRKFDSAAERLRWILVAAFSGPDCYNAYNLLPAHRKVCLLYTSDAADDM